MSRSVLLYFSWSRLGEADAPLEAIDDRFPALFELRRLFYPRYEPISDISIYNQGIAGFLDNVQKPNFAAFVTQAEREGGHPVIQVERELDDGTVTLLDEQLLMSVNTVVVISLDSLRTTQRALPSEVEAVRRFLEKPDNLIFICPHHDIGEADGLHGAERAERQLSEYLHHGDKAIPPRQGFGGFGRTLLAGLDAPVENRFGLRPATRPDGTLEPIEIDRLCDELKLLDGVVSFNQHPHLPQLERVGQGIDKLQVLARQLIDLTAPPHGFTETRDSFDALLQSAPGVFAGKLLVCDATMWSSTAGGLENLRRFWSNVIQCPVRE